MTATIEIGHTYSPDRLIKLGGNDFYSQRTGRWFADTSEAAQLRKIADTFGGSIRRVALLDDVATKEAQKKSEDSWRWQMFMNISAESVILGTGIEPENLFYESSFEKQARELISLIHNMDLPSGNRLSRDGTKLINGTGKNRLAIPLMGFSGVDDQTYPSCQLLDFAWLERRLEMADQAITVLPSSYEQQQNGVSILANLFGINQQLFKTVFYN